MKIYADLAYLENQRSNQRVISHATVLRELVMFSLEFVARKTKVLTNEICCDEKQSVRKVDNRKMETKFSSFSGAVLKFIY